MNYHSLRLVRTCEACPEQYEVFKSNRLVGYLRLRHGYFYVAYPDVGGQILYESTPKGDGEFYDDERDFEVQKALDAIHQRLQQERKERRN